MVGPGVHGIEKSLIQIEQVGPVVHIRHDHNLLLVGRVANDRIVDSYSFEVVIVGIISLNEGIGLVIDVRSDYSSKGFWANIQYTARRIHHSSHQ
jgi:hypothetical protein